MADKSNTIPDTKGQCEGKVVTLFYELKDISRQNFKGEFFPDNRFSKEERTFSIHVE